MVMIISQWPPFVITLYRQSIFAEVVFSPLALSLIRTNRGRYPRHDENVAGWRSVSFDTCNDNDNDNDKMMR